MVYKFAGSIHYSLISPLGERLVPLWVVGLIMGGGSIIQLLLDVPAGHILDRFGYLRMLKFTTFIFMFAGVALFFKFTLFAFLISVITATFGWLFYGPGINAYTLSVAPKTHAATFVSFRDIASSLGIFFGSAILGILLHLDTRLLGLLIFLAMTIALIALFFSPKDKVSVHAEQKIPTHHYYIRRHFIGDTLKILGKLNPASTMLLLVTLASSVFYGIIWFVVPLVIAKQANSGFFSLGLGIFDFAIVTLGFALGNLADRGNKRSLVFFGLLMFAVCGMLLGFNFNWLFLIFGFLATTGDEMASISLWSWLHNLDHEHAHDGRVAGVMSLFEDAGWAIGPILAGILYEPIGPTWTIVAGASIIFATWIVYQFMTREHKQMPRLAPIPVKPHRDRHRV